jgi:hypothetical protein
MREEQSRSQQCEQREEQSRSQQCEQMEACAEAGRGVSQHRSAAAEAAEAEAHRYILDRCAHRLYIDRNVVRTLTGWDAPHISRFVSAVQDTHWRNEGRRPRGRPRKNF